MTKPEDILPDGIDSRILDGKVVRKGTVASFLANIAIYESTTATQIEKSDAKKMLLSLAPSILAIGLHKFVTFKNPEVEKILSDAK